MLTDTITAKWSEPIAQSIPEIELIIFDIGEVRFGIPITKIDRIISNTHLERLAVCDSNQNHTLMENVTVIDLCDRLTGTAIVNPTAIVIFTSDQQLIGIPINTVPTLLAISIDLIRTLPHEFRITSPLGIASHLAIVPMSMTQITILILAN
jgi:chemotaxis signal transduction protein